MKRVEINFGTAGRGDRAKLEDAVESYLAALYRAGQVGGEDIVAWLDSQLVVTTQMTGLGANLRSSHSLWGRTELKKLKDKFGCTPVWQIRDDDRSKSNPRWEDAPELVLFTTAMDFKSPVCRGDDATAIPVFLLPVSESIKDDLVTWQKDYSLHDQMWLASGALELAAYRELVSLESDLSKEGRALCKSVEKSTGVRTYFFLMRYFSQRKEFARSCPGCGREWRTSSPEESKFWIWHFRCERCRLVANAGVERNPKLAKIGL